MRRHFTEEQDAVIAERYQAGESSAEIARSFGTGHYNVLSSLQRTGTPRRRVGDRPGALARNWKGGRFLTKAGYVMAYCRDEFPEMANTNGHTMEHRLVMARSLGRPLMKEERVHHLNGDRADNRVENLELWVVGHPAGQRAAEKPHCPTCSCRAISWTEE